jgi:hypothetical protein
VRETVSVELVEAVRNTHKAILLTSIKRGTWDNIKMYLG